MSFSFQQLNIKQVIKQIPYFKNNNMNRLNCLIISISFIGIKSRIIQTVFFQERL